LAAASRLPEHGAIIATLPIHSVFGIILSIFTIPRIINELEEFPKTSRIEKKLNPKMKSLSKKEGKTQTFLTYFAN
jgi:hypothetical protein